MACKVLVYQILLLLPRSGECRLIQLRSNTGGDINDKVFRTFVHPFLHLPKARIETRQIEIITQNPYFLSLSFACNEG